MQGMIPGCIIRLVLRSYRHTSVSTRARTAAFARMSHGRPGHDAATAAAAATAATAAAAAARLRLFPLRPLLRLRLLLLPPRPPPLFIIPGGCL